MEVLKYWSNRNKGFQGKLELRPISISRSAVTFRAFMNRILRTPKRVTREFLSSGAVIETQHFNNKKIIKVYGI
jgi:hypothetical protein